MTFFIMIFCAIETSCVNLDILLCLSN